MKSVVAPEGLNEKLNQIIERNKKVESDKAWELSWARKMLVFVLTYIAISSYFYFAGLPQPFLNSIVPAPAFVISTLTLPHFKQVWIKYVYKK